MPQKTSTRVRNKRRERGVTAVYEGTSVETHYESTLAGYS